MKNTNTKPTTQQLYRTRQKLNIENWKLSEKMKKAQSILDKLRYRHNEIGKQISATMQELRKRGEEV